MNQSKPARSVSHTWRVRALQRQIARLDRCLGELEAKSARLSTWRLLCFILLLVVGAAVLLTWGPIPWLIVSAFFLTLFILLIYKHREVESAANRLRIWQRLKRDQLARMLLDWEQMPPIEPIDTRQQHPFAADLDLVGDRSVQRVIDLAQTVEGSELLRQWLLEFEPDVANLRVRQQLTQDLTHLPSFIARLSLNALAATGYDGSDMHGRWSSAHLFAWLGERLDSGSLRMALIVLLLLSPLNIILLFAYIQEWLPPIFLITWFVYGAVAVSQLRYIEPVFRDAAATLDSLRVLEAVLSFINDKALNRFPALQKLTEPLREQGQVPADLLRRTNRLLTAAGLRYNPFIALAVNAVFPLDVLVAYRLNMLKGDLQRIIPKWLTVWRELEALGSLANFAYLYPEATYPHLVFAEREAVPFFAVNLGHPLIPSDKRICNDFQISELGELVLITGSNMAGKSTFLRTIGVNLRLALSGAPVLADEIVTIPFRLFASITVTDSLTDGFSFFYAEVQRLKRLLDYLNEKEGFPIFFLIDEIFRGTNNRERLIGSRAYVHTLVGGNGCGAIATHDLELVQLAQNNPALSNYHFRDDVREGRMVFDYLLRPGPCPTTNALRIMRLAGLPVESAEEEL